jgi:hypothetical protein
MCARGLVTVLCLTAANVARAQTASEYLQYCKEFERNVVQRGSELRFPNGGAANCWHFFVAFRELADMREVGASQPNLGLCIPPAVRLSQVIRIFVLYADAHPEVLHEEPAALAWQAVWHHFNCDKTP